MALTGLCSLKLKLVLFSVWKYLWSYLNIFWNNQLKKKTLIKLIRTDFQLFNVIVWQDVGFCLWKQKHRFNIRNDFHSNMQLLGEGPVWWLFLQMRV